MIRLTQSDGETLTFPKIPERIVSLVPSITEDLILFGKIPVGRSSFCIEPKGIVDSITVIGGTKTPRISKIVSLRPDLVIANQEENNKKDVREIREQSIPVWVTFPKKIVDVIALIREMSQLCDHPEKNDRFIEQIQNLLDGPELNARWLRTITLIWKNPWMALGNETYASDLLRFCGFFNPVVGRYPELTETEILESRPDLLILPTEPYEFNDVDVMEWQKAVPTTLFSGEDLLWPGTRILRAIEGLREIYQRFEEKKIR